MTKLTKQEIQNIAENIETYIEECGKWEGELETEELEVLDVLEKKGHDIYTQGNIYPGDNGKIENCDVPFLIFK